ncbi:SsrA-binding protein, partial [Mycobacterium tuberculosis]|nr:SsrA-binding protein [Mycobacterium tuberculosis]
MSNDRQEHRKLAAENRKARFDFEILDTFEAGIALHGSEIKSLRGGKATIAESYAGAAGRNFVLYNAYIPEYLQANRFNHETRRPRQLLMHRREIDRLLAAIERQ